MIDFLLAGTFWSTSAAVYAVGVVVVLLILFWDWRLLLPGLAVVQYGIGQILIHRYGVPGQWLAIYVWVILLAVLILSLFPIQMRMNPQADQGGNALFRGLLLLLFSVIISSLPLNIPLPVLDVFTARFFIWLAVCGLLILALTDSPLFTGGGLLLWFIPVQSWLALIVPLPALIALLGSLGLAIALACSYLTVAGSEQVAEQQLSATDVTFPSEEPAVAPFMPVFAWLRRLVAKQLAAISAVLKRVSQ